MSLSDNEAGRIGRPFWEDPSFANLLAHNAELEGMRTYLPTHIQPGVFAGQAQIRQLSSSYRISGYDYFFYALTRVLRPTRCVEIGVLQGFSLLTIASALRDSGVGLIEGFDLFEKYPFRNERYSAVVERIKDLGLQPWARIHPANAFDLHLRYDEVDFLHVDISNDGETYRRIFAQWAGKVKKVMLFEGGSAERDRVEWMIKYNKPPIGTALRELRKNYPGWTISVLNAYPSITVATRDSRQEVVQRHG